MYLTIFNAIWLNILNTLCKYSNELKAYGLVLYTISNFEWSSEVDN